MKKRNGLGAVLAKSANPYSAANVKHAVWIFYVK